MNTRLRDIAVLFTVTLALVWCIPSGGQVLKGSISGTVIDPQGAVVSGAQVKAKNVETGVVNSTTTDSSGLFRLNLLAAGTYTVDFAAQGFKTASTKDVVVVAGRDTGLGAIHMAIGEASTTVEVSAEAPLIEPTQSQVTNTFAGTTLSTFAGIEENEGLDKLALFVPGTIASRSNNFSNTNGAGFSSNGLRGRNNDQEIDGQTNNDNSVAGPALFLTDPNFVQQYVIVTNNFGPEYGRNAGSVVNIITKSGTNAWHGSVFGAENSSYLNALTNTQKNTNKFGTNTGLPGTITCPPTQPLCNPLSGPPRSNDEIGGGTIGGPIVKNKWFVFGGFDEEIFSGNGIFTTSLLTPTPAGLAHLGGCGVNANALTALTTYGPYAFGFGNPSPRNVRNITIGTCNNTTLGLANSQVEVGGVSRIVPIPSHVFNWVVRNDVTLGGDSFTARYLFNRNNNFNGDDNGAAGWFNNVPDFNQAILTSWTHNFTSRMVNEARISFGRLGVEFGGGLNPFEPVAGQLKSALANISFQTGGGLGFGPATNLPQSRLVNNWQAQDNWNYVFGRHQLKAGVNWTYQRSPNIFLPNVNGAYRFTSLNSFLTTDQPNRIIIAQGNPNLDFREYDTFLFAGDDWKISQNLTLNLGLTWTYYGQPANLFHDLTTKAESSPSTALWLQSLPLAQRTNPVIPAVTDSYGPTVGFAYSPQWGGFLTGHGKTVLRGGYRMLYDPPFYNIFVNISSSAPMTFLQTLTASTTPSVTGQLMPGNPTGPNVRAALAPVIATNTFDPRTQNETNVSPDFGPDKVHSWSFGLERELSKSAALELRYSGNHAVNLFQTVDSNPYLGTPAVPGRAAGLLQTFPQFIPNASSLTPCAATQQSGPGAGTDVGRVNCGLGVSRTRSNGGFSDYHAAQVEFRTNNLWKQLTMRTGYTWSKNLDNVSEIFATGTAGNTTFAAQNPFQTGGAERSISGLNYPHVFTLLLTENLPFFKEQHGLVGHILGGWSISADYIYGTGQPYTPAQTGFEALTTTNTCTDSAGNPFAPTCIGNFYDGGFVGAFLAADAARPFFGNPRAPENAVGIYAADACESFFRFGSPSHPLVPGPNAAFPGMCNTNITPANTLLSLNSLNAGGSFLSGPGTAPGAAPATVTKDQVRFIVNGQMAQSVFGTPFGNVPRNVLRDAPQNVVNASVFKNIKLGEHTSFELRLTANNVLNHFNFLNVDPAVEDAGLANFRQGFANPSLTQTTAPLNGYRIVWIGGRFFF